VKKLGKFVAYLATLQSHEISCRPVMQTAAQYTEPLAPFRSLSTVQERHLAPLALALSSSSVICKIIPGWFHA